MQTRIWRYQVFGFAGVERPAHRQPRTGKGGRLHCRQISGKFQSFGLKPADGKSFYQAFEVTTNAKLRRANRFHYSEVGKTHYPAFP